MAELKLTYGIDTNERLVHVNDVVKGKDCLCVCPGCGAQLIAKKGEKNQHHFAHANGADCAGARMTALHMLAQQIIHDEKRIRTPEYRGDHTRKGEEDVVFSEVRLEMQYNEEGVNRRPDCVGIIGDKQLWVEIKVTHGIDNAKLDNIKANKILCIEIDFSSLLNIDYTEKDIHNILFTSVGDDKREWINNPELDAQDETKREEFIQNLKNKIKTDFQNSLNLDQDQQQYPDYIVKIREELYHIANYWMNSGTKESAEWVIYHIYNPYQDRNYVIHIGDFLVPNKDYLSFVVNSPKNQYTLDVFNAIFDYDNRTGVRLYNVDITKMKILLSELLKLSNATEENRILTEGLSLFSQRKY